MKLNILRKPGHVILFLSVLLLPVLSGCSKKSDESPEDSMSDTTEVPGAEINQSLVTPSSSYEANAVYQFLIQNYGRKIISGVMTLNSFDETSWLKENTGKDPAIIGLDFMHCNRGYSWYENSMVIM